tara:strand:+ start:10289 stop:10582 length:294 start_codon:yes stop_codon:yes gene_type:complete
MLILNKFSLGRAALPLATLAALTVAILIYLIRGKFYLFLHGCLFIYIAFGSIRTYVAYKNEGGFSQLKKDTIVIIIGIIILFFLSVGLGFLFNSNLN